MDHRGTLTPVGASEPGTAGGQTDPDPAAAEHGNLGWRDDALARQWARGDRLGPLLALPRRIAGVVIAHSDPPVRVIVDLGSGTGAFLDAVLSSCQQAAGIWTDVSEAMQELAQQQLAHLRDRVEFRLADATSLAAALPDLAAVMHQVAPAAPGGGACAVVTSRFSHHLEPEQLRAFYAAAARLAGPGGWMANLDHVFVSEPWAARLAQARAEMVPPNPSAHRHDRPLCTLDDHLGALSAAGWDEVTVAWRAFATVLFLGRRTSW